MPKVPQVALLTALLAFTALRVADAAEFDPFIAFGDSTLDTEYFRYHSAGADADGVAFNLGLMHAIFDHGITAGGREMGS
ncbi:MAG: hypothetical protein ACYC3X_09945 [Pirellulaceae bacterium]